MRIRCTWPSLSQCKSWGVGGPSEWLDAESMMDGGFGATGAYMNLHFAQRPLDLKCILYLCVFRCTALLAGYRGGLA